MLERELARLAAPLVRAGVLQAGDWSGRDLLPSTLIRQGWARHVRRGSRGAPDAMDLHLILEPWYDALERAGETVTPADEARLAVTIDAGSCVIVPLDDMRARWGDTAAGVVATALRHGLGRVLNVWDPDDLEWIAEWWVECLDCHDEDDEETRRFELDRLAEFQAAQAEVRDSYLRLRSRAELAQALQALPPGAVRRSAAALLAEARAPRRAWPNRALEQLRSSEDGHPTAAVLLTRHANDAVRHAYDELQEQTMNSGCCQPYHAVLLLDTRTSARLAATLRQLHRVLRTLSWGERLVYAIQGLQESAP